MSDLENIFVQIEIALVVGERHLNLVPDFKETEVDDRGDSCRRNGDPMEILLELEREEEEVQHDRESKMERVG